VDTTAVSEAQSLMAIGKQSERCDLNHMRAAMVHEDVRILKHLFMCAE